MVLLKTYTISTDVTLGSVSPSRLSSELSADVVNLGGVQVNGDSLEVYGDSFTEANVDTIVLNHDSIPLDEYKAAKNLAIDYKTGALISVGFTYDSETFSTSGSAQINWSSIKANTSDYTFPLAISTKSDGEYSLAEVDVVAFWTAGKDFVLGHLDSGRALKLSVNAATDKAGVDAVIDNR